jgi:L,D-peptidoglycan transpeptidase YkuD (ErfK/YbiS/YcfS/YnhG family)
MNRIFLLCCLLAALSPVALSQAPAPLHQSTQLIVVTTSSWTAVSGRLQRYQRPAPGRAWLAVGDPIPIVVGKAGLGWGIGEAPVTAARSAADPVKHEGDRRAPAGIFRFGTAFGYSPLPPSGWKVPYLAIVPTTHCVDDPHSRFYNRIVDSSRVPPDWNSSESMRNAGIAYTWGIVIDHNANPPIPGDGSCVFMHIWSGPTVGTVGCTAMPEPDVRQVLAWLNPAYHPLLVQMPLAQYQRIEKSLRLPLPPTP